MTPSPRAKTPPGSRTYPRAALITAALLAFLLLIHMFFSLTYNMPNKAVRAVLPTGAANSYIQPYLVQDYKIFAPDPAGADHQLWVRAWVEDADKKMVTTEWLNVTEVELSETYRKVLRKQLTIIAAERVMSSFHGLTPEQRTVAAENYHRTGSERLRKDLISASPKASTAAVDSFLRNTGAVDAYATQVAYAAWEDVGEIRAVQTRVVYDHVVRWSSRNDPNAKRPTPSLAATGWRQPKEFAGQDREKFSATFREWMND